MTSRRIRKYLALLGLTFALPVVANAQTSRVEGMDLQGDYIKDYTGMYTYTSSVNNVGNLVYGELGVSPSVLPFPASIPVDRSVGAVMGDLWEGRYGAWAVHLREFTPQLGQGDRVSSPAPGDLGFDPNFHANESFDLMWGKKFGTTSLGLRLNRSVAQVEADNGAYGTITNLEYDWGTSPDDTSFANLSRNILGFGGGLGFELSPTMNLELGVLWQNRSYQITDVVGAATQASEEDGPTTYQVAARAWWQWKPNVMVVPVFKWTSYDLSTKNFGGPTLDNSLKSWQVGAAGNWTIGSNDLFVLGATFAQNRVEQQTAVLAVPFPDPTVNPPSGLVTTDNGKITETFAPQVFAALETHVNSWLTLRLGANKGAWHNVEIVNNTAPAADLKWKDSPFSMNLGAGVKVGTLQLDGVLNPNFANNGLYLFSGNSTDPLFAKVTATYSY
jgi:hypothetical protein